MENEIKLKPIGYIKNEIKERKFRNKAEIEPEIRKQQARTNYQAVKKMISELIIEPSLVELLDGIDDFSHIMVIYWPHLLTDEERQLKKVHPMGRKDIPLKGIFATRSPARPNSVLISTVKLLGRKANILTVQGLDALNQSPIIDIKPLLIEHYGDDKPTFPEWINQINSDLES